VGGEVSLTDPSFLQSEVSAELSVFGSRREEPSFTRIETGTGLTFSRRFTPIFRSLLGYQYRRSDVSDVAPDAEELDEDVNISSINFAPTWDWRDNLLAPRTGGYTRLTLEWAAAVIGSQLDFVRGGFDQSLFFRLAQGTVVGLNARAGAIVPTGSTSDIPIQERFFNGGENTVRSFKEDELGPRDADNDPIGGEAWTLASIELRQAIRGSFEGALFYDVGNVTEEAEDFWEFADYRSGVGVGVRYMLPIGPLRLDWAVNPNPRDEEDDWTLHFSVGMSF
jgi:outer membrane protein assembly factor BamA